jgi:hypothetical protein
MPSADFKRLFPRRGAIQRHVGSSDKLEELQQRATLKLSRRFTNYDIDCVACFYRSTESPGVADPAS